jgi:hypothetical protein
MHITFTIECDLERIEGKFATKEELAEQIVEELASAEPGQLEGENGGQYEVTSWEVAYASD